MFLSMIQKAFSTAPVSIGWPWVIKEFNTGDWQRNIEYHRGDVLCYYAVFACITLIASDISKLQPRRVLKDSDGIWNPVPFKEFSVAERPNDYQNRIQFYESWLLSKLIRGNAFIFKVRGKNKQVVELHVLHPDRVLPLVSEETGEVFYQLSQDNLSGITETGITVPASEIIHDRFNCFFHPLVGLSPLFAASLPAFMGETILKSGTKLFKNGGRPNGILTVPEAISKEKAAELSALWEANYGGDNVGKTAILGGDLKYTPLSMKADEMEIIRHLEMTAEMVCSTFHVPPYKIGIGATPAYNNVQALNLEYYNSALHRPIEDVELCLDEGLEFKRNSNDEVVDGVEFDLTGLLRMDTKTQVEVLGEGVLKAIYAPNEARKLLNIKPTPGGDTPFLQQQMWPIQVLADRTIEDLEPVKEEVVEEEPQESEDEQGDELKAMKLAMTLRKELL